MVGLTQQEQEEAQLELVREGYERIMLRPLKLGTQQPGESQCTPEHCCARCLTACGPQPASAAVAFGCTQTGSAGECMFGTHHLEPAGMVLEEDCSDLKPHRCGILRKLRLLCRHGARLS